MNIEKTKPKWVEDRNNIKHDESIVFIGKLGVDSVVNGKLPNGESYEWTKSHRSFKRRKRT